jgi:ribosome biogenesis protein MAK21
MDEDEDDLIEVDDEDAFVSAFPPEADEEEDAAEEETAGDGKRKRNNAEDRKERKKKRKLPMFGSYEDWQKIIDDGGPEDNI